MCISSSNLSGGPAARGHHNEPEVAAAFLTRRRSKGVHEDPPWRTNEVTYQSLMDKYAKPLMRDNKSVAAPAVIARRTRSDRLPRLNHAEASE